MNQTGSTWVGSRLSHFTNLFVTESAGICLTQDKQPACIQLEYHMKNQAYTVKSTSDFQTQKNIQIF